MSGIDHGKVPVVGQFDQALRGLGLGHLILFAQQEEGGARYFAHGHFALVVAVASLEADVENILVGVAGQDPSHQCFAATQQPSARAKSAGRWRQCGV